MKQTEISADTIMMSVVNLLRSWQLHCHVWGLQQERVTNSGNNIK